MSCQPSKKGFLEIEGLTKKYNEFVAVQGVSLRVDPGEFITLLGPSGSGKTTTLRVLAGFANPTEGKIRLDGADVTSIPTHRRNIGMVFQNYALFPHMTALENVIFPLRMRSIDKSRARRMALDALELVHLGALGHRKPHELSGGQQQRVALARAIVYTPNLLLMDEPLGALDKNLREAMQVEIKRLSRQLGVSVIFVTHDQEEALTMSDRIGVFDQGRVVQIGTSMDLYERPATMFVAAFLGEANFFFGTFDGEIGVASDVRLVRGKVRDPAQRLSLRKGDPVAATIRPERVRIRTQPASGHSAQDTDSVSGRVEELIYLGTTMKYSVKIDGGVSHLVRVPASSIDETIQVGTPVELFWNPQDVMIVSGTSTTNAGR